jgi:hypothetical protein
MTNLDTYNRVKSLELNRLGTLVNLCYFSLILFILGGLASPVLPSGQFIPPISSVAGATLILAAVYYWDRKRRKKCQFCGHMLSFVNRPFLLDNNYLSMKGLKEGDYFYTKCVWGTYPLIKRWTRISNRSIVCHHCRLTEERSSKYFESISQGELERIGQKINS